MIAASVKRITLKTKTMGRDFGLRLALHDGGQRLLEVLSVPTDSPFAGLPTECPVVAGDVLLAVGKYTLCQEYADVSAAQDLLECATVPCSIVFVPKSLVTSLPNEPLKLEWIARAASVSTPASLRKHVQKWRAEQMVKELQPPEISAINVANLDLSQDKAHAAAAGSHFIGSKTCLVCTAHPKDTILGCGHGFCSSCSSRMHMCPIKACQRIILSRTPMEHRFRSAFDEMATMGNGMPTLARAIRNAPPVDFPAADFSQVQMSPLGSVLTDDCGSADGAVTGAHAHPDDDSSSPQSKATHTTPTTSRSALRRVGGGECAVEGDQSQVAKTLDFERMDGGANNNNNNDDDICASSSSTSSSKPKKKKRGAAASGKKRHRVVDVIEVVSPAIHPAAASSAAGLAGTDV
jgi:hypothetical protein